MPSLSFSKPNQNVNLNKGVSRAVDKRECLVIIRDNFCLFCINTYVETPSSESSQCDGSDEGSDHMFLMRRKIIIKYSLLFRAVV